ncbi:uncharacterized protein PAN0_008c3481 [Moesziomyces antarcticus]|uniref:Uncharacterized protein n=1 Tax=Pseudozyma antarctica TaxID=84753 RepID=A0A081CF18_PSEA2|nr:uncharacterized protein PAN0_008c3481 [Moesziomyces antarcticus]GAK65264.1 hypothetical protein PAN0_008c3481 [Moesziomyces antarcticus]
MRVFTKRDIRSDARRRIIAASPAPSVAVSSQGTANNVSTNRPARPARSSAGYTRVPARSIKRRRLATPPPPQRIEARKPPQLHTNVRRIILERHWVDCSACREAGRECVPPQADSMQRKCWRCRAKTKIFCDGCFWMDYHSVRKFKQLLDAGLDIEEVDQRVWGAFPGVLGGPFDKCKTYSFAAESTSNDHEFVFNPALHTL